MSEAKILTIIGNGFDLQLGYKTKFEDFFVFLQNHLEQCNNTDEFHSDKYYTEKLKTISKNWWYNYFVSVKRTTGYWSDIEKEIERVCCKKKYKGKFDELLTQLKELEELFKVYLDIIKCNGDTFGSYLDNAEHFLIYLWNYIYDEESRVNDGRISEQFCESDISKMKIFSFNYGIIENAHNWASTTYNVHGINVPSEEIIFGIDDTAQVQKGAEIFKKTYRKMFLSQRINPLPETLDFMLFYGHGLAKADYSYFQSLFDMYDIYKSKTILVFFINDYVEDVNKKVKTIYDLMHHYGETTHGSVKGGNLLHKLLVENRIRIVKMSEMPKSKEETSTFTEEEIRSEMFVEM